MLGFFEKLISANTFLTLCVDFLYYILLKNSHVNCIFILEQSLPDGFPELIEIPQRKAIEKGRNAVLMCTAKGSPKPRIYWLKDMYPVNLTNPRYSLMQQGMDTLLIMQYFKKLISNGIQFFHLHVYRIKTSITISDFFIFKEG